MRVLASALIFAVGCVLPAAAFLGDSPAQTSMRYGQPVASSGQPGRQTSTQTFAANGLVITCGYVGGKVEMESYTRSGPAFNSSEIEALLRSNGSRSARWIPPAQGYVDGTYKRPDGVTAILAGSQLTIQSPKWNQAVAADEKAEKTNAAASGTSASPNDPNPNYSTGAATNAASYVEPAGPTVPPASGSTTNAP